MGKSRIYEIAKELNIDSKLIVEKLKEMNVDVKNHMSSITEEESMKACSKTAGAGKRNCRQETCSAAAGRTSKTGCCKSKSK